MPADKINRPFKIILSSGPRGGKSVISKKIAEWFSNEYLVFVIPETARELFDMGLIFDDNPYEAQKSIIRRQLIKEKEIFDKLSTSVDSNKTIVVFDRTCIDAGTFLPVEEFSKLLQEENLTKDDIASNLHDALVLHMQSVAVTRPEFYEKRNQASSVIRRESAVEAAFSDEKIFKAYEQYKNIFKDHILIKATDKIEEKSETVYKVISEFIKSSSMFSY